MPTPKPVPPPVQMREEFPLEIRRTFAVPRERVFAAWAEREQLERWMCKDVAKHEVTHHEQDIRPGGNWRMEIVIPRRTRLIGDEEPILKSNHPKRLSSLGRGRKKFWGRRGKNFIRRAP